MHNSPRVLSASTIMSDDVVNAAGEDLGRLEEIMLDLNGGCIAYAVLSFGGFLGMGDKLFAIPWQAFSMDTDEETLVLNVDRRTLERAPGFDKDNWPATDGDDGWLVEVYEYYGYDPYWQ
jgi:sporulation protein YlmC with PRC-barrel domain